MRNWKFKESDFSDFPVYMGNDLGIFWTPERTKIRIWAPSAQRVFFRLYTLAGGGKPTKEFQLLPDEDGTWIYEISDRSEERRVGKEC